MFLRRFCLTFISLAVALGAIADDRVISVKEAIDIANKLQEEEITEEVYDVEGAVLGINHVNHQLKALNIEMGSDEVGIFSFHTMAKDSLPFDSLSLFHSFDTIIVHARLEKFKGTPCLFQGYLKDVRPYIDPRIEFAKESVRKDYELKMQDQKISFYAIIFVLVVLLLIGAVIFFFMSARSKQKERELFKGRAELDFLTGLYNRFGGETRIKTQLAEHRKGYLGVLDVDWFKSVNDTYGHSVGDKLLAEIAHTLWKTPNTICMRLGGDEFIFFYATENKDEFREQAEALLKKMSEISFPEIGTHRVSVSIGAAYYDGTADISFDNIYRKTDKLLYESKRKGGNTVTIEG